MFDVKNVENFKQLVKWNARLTCTNCANKWGVEQLQTCADIFTLGMCERLREQ